ETTMETDESPKQRRLLGALTIPAGASFPDNDAMKPVVVAGAGKIGATIADMLAASGDYRVTLIDRAVNRLEGSNPAIETKAVDVTDPRALSDVLKGNFAVLSAVPFNLTGDIAVAAKEADVHYLDLTEDV